MLFEQACVSIVAQFGRVLVLWTLWVLYRLLLVRFDLTCQQCRTAIVICHTTFHKPLFVLRRSVSILSEDTTRLTMMTMTIILFKVLHITQIEMNLLITAVVWVLPLVIRPVIREVNWSNIVFQRVLFRVESLFLASIFVRIRLEEALARTASFRRHHALIYRWVRAELHVWLWLSHTHRVLYTLMKWIVLRFLPKFSLIPIHVLSSLLVYCSANLAFLIVIILLILILLLYSVVLFSFSLQIYTFVIFAIWKRYFMLLES